MYIDIPDGKGGRSRRYGVIIATIALTGDIIEALAAGGLLWLRGVLIGTVMFRQIPEFSGTAPALLVVDAGVAQDYAISR